MAGYYANTLSTLSRAKLSSFRPIVLLTNDQQSYVRSNTESQKDDFEYRQERVNHCIESFSGNGKPLMVHAIQEVWCKDTCCGPEDEHGAVDDYAPHKKRCQSLNVHDIRPCLI